MGIYIDVFPIDFLPNSKYKINKIFLKCRLLGSFMASYTVKDLRSVASSKYKLFVKKIIVKMKIDKIIFLIIKKYKLDRKILKYIDNIASKYNNTDTVACISGRYLKKEIMPSNYISDYILVDFEGEKFKAPIGYDEYLKKHYGNYMQLPPKDKQVKEHDNIAFWKK